jgi:hypothetical protein
LDSNLVYLSHSWMFWPSCVIIMDCTPFWYNYWSLNFIFFLLLGRNM